MSKQNILITGCAGLFGSHLCEHFLKQGHEVLGIDNLQGGYRDFVPKNVLFYKKDLRDSKEIQKLFEKYRPEYVYHTAAFAAVCLSPFMKHECYENNLLSYSNIINCSVNYEIKKIIALSSMDVYGQGNPPFTEDQIPSPEDTYGISKYAMEMDLKNTYEQFGLRYSIVRPHNVMGTKQNIWDRYRNVLGIWILKILNNQPITIYGDGLQERAFSDIEYYMNPLNKLMDEKYDGEIYNIGADKPVTIIEAAEMAKTVAEENGYKNVKIVHLEPRNEVKVAYSDHTKAKRDLNFQDKTDLKNLLTKMLLWAEKQPKRNIKTVNYEIIKGLYSYWK